MNDLTDAELITRVLAGERNAYRPIVERYQNRIHAVVYGMLHNAEDARDLTQNAFIKAYQSLKDFRIESSFYTWLYRIAVNLAIDHCRKTKRRKTSAFDEALGNRDDDGNLMELHHVENPQKLLQRKELRDKIFAAMDELSEEQRQVILLREVEGLSYKEISDVMDIPEGTVMSRLFYARRRMQAVLKDLSG